MTGTIRNTQSSTIRRILPPHPDHNPRYPYNPSKEWEQAWFDRLKDLLDQHHPDLFYFDGAIPFGKTGRELVA